jgi:cytosine deaminase
MVITLAPCWYCSGLVRQFGFRTAVVVGEQRTSQGGVDRLRSLGVKVIDLDSRVCDSADRLYPRTKPGVVKLGRRVNRHLRARRLDLSADCQGAARQR